MATQQHEWINPKGKTSRERIKEGWKVSYHIITRRRTFCSLRVRFAFRLQKHKPLISKRKEKEKKNNKSNKRHQATKEEMMREEGMRSCLSLSLYKFVEDQNFTRKAHSMKSNERPWVLTKEGSIHEARRINIKALCMFRFPAKRPIKNPAKSSERTGPGYPEAWAPRDVQHSESGIETTQKGTTKYKKQRTDMSFSSIQWCSKELESLESDNS